MKEKDKHLSILLAEDNPVDILMTKEALKYWKIKTIVYVVENGQDALNFLRRQGNYTGEALPDLILLDLNLPQKSGKEILSEVKQDPNLSGIPVVVVTTSDAVDDMQTCLDLGARLFITKPLHFDDYVQAINSIQEFWRNSQ
jgi:chemotaxis family two-component system response regulator Rcp1